MPTTRKDLFAFGVLIIVYAVLESRAQFIVWRDKFRASPVANYLRTSREQLIREETDIPDDVMQEFKEFRRDYQRYMSRLSQRSEKGANSDAR